MWTIISFVGFTLLVAVISYWATRDDHLVDSDAYFLAGRGLTAWVIAGSLLLTNLSTEHLIGLNGDAFNHTIAVMAWETTAALAMVLTALYFLPRYLKSGFATIPQFLAERFDQQTRVIATLLFLFSYVLAILPVVLRFGAAGLESLFDVSENLGLSATQTWLLVWGVGTLGSLYAVFDGLKAVAVSDTVNGVGFLIGGLLVTALALNHVGDGSMWAGLAEVYTEERPKFDITGDEPGSFLPFGVLFTGMIVNQVFFWCTNQSIVQRALGAKNLAEGQKRNADRSRFEARGAAHYRSAWCYRLSSIQRYAGTGRLPDGLPHTRKNRTATSPRRIFCCGHGRRDTQYLQQCVEQLGNPVQPRHLSRAHQQIGHRTPVGVVWSCVQHRVGVGRLYRTRFPGHTFVLCRLA